MAMLDFTIARIVRLVVGVVVAIILLAIVFVLLDANGANGIVSTVRSWAGTLTEPFHHIFNTSSAKATLALNYGIAILVYLAIAAIVEALFSGTAFTRRGRALPY
jgi:uncharacterized membrane protein